MSKTFIVTDETHPLFGQRVQGNNGVRVRETAKPFDPTKPATLDPYRVHNRTSKSSKRRNADARRGTGPKTQPKTRPVGTRSYVADHVTKSDLRRVRKQKPAMSYAQALDSLR